MRTIVPNLGGGNNASSLQKPRSGSKSQSKSASMDSHMRSFSGRTPTEAELMNPPGSPPREPVDRDGTGSTMRSTPERKGARTPNGGYESDDMEEDTYYYVEESPKANRLPSPAAKVTKSVTYSTKYNDPDQQLSLVDLPTSMPSSGKLQNKEEPVADTLPLSPKQGTLPEHQAKDDYYEVEASPDVRRYSSPPAKFTKSVTYSTKYARDPLEGLPREEEIHTQNEITVASASVSVVDLPQSMASVADSLSAARYDSPPVKGSNSVTFSTKFARDPTAAGSQQPHERRLDTTLETAENSSPETRGSGSPDSYHYYSGDSGSSRKTDPEAHRIVKRVPSNEEYILEEDPPDSGRLPEDGYDIDEGDQYYDVPDSPRASAGELYSNLSSSATTNRPTSRVASYNASKHAKEVMGENYPPRSKRSGSMNFKPVSSSSSSHAASSSLLYSSGSGATMMNSAGTPTVSASDSNRHRLYFTSLKGDTDSSHSGWTERRKKGLFGRFGKQQQQQQQRQQNQYLNQLSSGPEVTGGGGGGPMDPDGQVNEEDNYSTHGESLAPTPDDDTAFQSTEQLGDSEMEGTSSPPSRSSPASPDNGSNDEKSKESGESASAGTPPQPKPKHSKFPSIPVLVFASVVVVLCVGTLAGGLTYYLWDKKSLDPIRPPTQAPVPGEYGPPPPTVHATGGDMPPIDPSVLPSDATLLQLFAFAIGQDSVDNSSSAAKAAADWMLNEDPRKQSMPRTSAGWIQRYLLVYTYFSTTGNGESTWLSCNPPSHGEEDARNSDECRFAYPTELPNGDVIFDLVPSTRWLSGTDECRWGGVACGKTVIDEASGTSMRAVTSIVLAQQLLRGSIVTELTALPELEMLDLSHNGLSGTLSESFRSLQTLRLQYNDLTGTIPVNFFDDQSVMKELNVGSNNMTGTIPGQVAQASQMTGLYLFDNGFTGSIPILGEMPLTTFQAQNNRLSGMLPFDLHVSGKWPDTLTTWWVFGNQLSGPIGETLGYLSSLEDFRVQDNRLTGRIPESIGDLQRLFRFEVNSNALTGTVPDEISDLPVLRDVQLQFNEFRGVVPPGLCFLTSMETLEADCLDIAVDGFLFEAPPRTECYCCTSCCDPIAKECVTY